MQNAAKRGERVVNLDRNECRGAYVSRHRSERKPKRPEVVWILLTGEKIRIGSGRYLEIDRISIGQGLGDTVTGAVADTPQNIEIPDPFRVDTDDISCRCCRLHGNANNICPEQDRIPAVNKPVTVVRVRKFGFDY